MNFESETPEASWWPKNYRFERYPREAHYYLPWTSALNGGTAATERGLIQANSAKGCSLLKIKDPLLSFTLLFTQDSLAQVHIWSSFI
jgi:hypothetical protein